MIKRLLIFSFSFIIGILFLTSSIFRIADIKYILAQGAPDSEVSSGDKTRINYELTQAGRVLPDSMLWPFKAFRDRVWLTLTPDPLKKAELCLTLADKRLSAAKILFESGKIDDALPIMTKGEKYLELSKVEERIAHQNGADTTEFLQKYSLAALKHREVLEKLASIVPDNIKPMVLRAESYPKRLYSDTRNNLLDEGAHVAQNPFK